MSNSDLTVRDATPRDAEAIARIYNQGIEDGVATLETTRRTTDERRQWLEGRSERHPVLVAVTHAGDVLGWASLNQFNPRSVYDHVADFSVYVDRAARGSGVGHLLLEALEHRARQIGFHKLVLAAFPTNTAGMRLYQRRGFTTVGIYHEQGLLNGAWIDVILMEKILN
jgi:L-amino acid N-acyltransferase YncA